MDFLEILASPVSWVFRAERVNRVKLETTVYQVSLAIEAMRAIRVHHLYLLKVVWAIQVLKVQRDFQVFLVLRVNAVPPEEPDCRAQVVGQDLGESAVILVPQVMSAL